MEEYLDGLYIFLEIIYGSDVIILKAAQSFRAALGCNCDLVTVFSRVFIRIARLVLDKTEVLNRKQQ